MEKKKVLILGAGGAIARNVIEFLRSKTNIELTLFARYESEIRAFESFAHIVLGDVLHPDDLNAAVKGKDIVYANLAGNVDKMAAQIVRTMEENQVKRLIFITALGIYNEIPGAFGKWNDAVIGKDLIRYRKAADVIEASSLEYTIIRPAWLTDYDEVDYELTQKNEPFKGTEVSRKSVAAYISDLIEHPEKGVKTSVGIDKPGTEGDKPAFM